MFDKRVQLLIAFGYDGGRFHGLQPQPDYPTAGAALRQRFEDAGEWPKALCYAARTDAGVHAERNLATCWLRNPKDADATVRAVGADRDDGLRIETIERVPINVHARAISAGKHYRYRIADDRGALPAQGPRTWCVTPRLDVEAMRAAAVHLVGEHDFTSMRARRCNAPNPVRDIHSVQVRRDDKGIVIDVRGRSFARYMVRIMAGTLAAVGAGWFAPGDIGPILAARDRRAAGPTAPGHGLTLVEVLTRRA